LEAFLATFGPSASARIRSFPVRIPPSNIVSISEPTASTISGKHKDRSIELPSGVIRDHDSAGSRFDGELGILNIENSLQDKFAEPLALQILRRRRETII
jgi:hypothetical protein